MFSMMPTLLSVFRHLSICWVLAGNFLVSDDSDSPFRNYAHSLWYKNILIPILTQLPLLMRFNQCLRKFHDTGERFPHLANAGKYALSQMVTLAGTFHPIYLEYTSREKGNVFPFYQVLWTFLFISSSLYSFAWDVYMDWGLGKKEHGYLGPLLMYPRKYYYFCTIALDLVLRFMWVLTLVPPSSGAAFAVPEYLTALSMMLELFRRTVWGFFRLENEHRSNASGYRRVDFVPLHFNTGHQHHYEDKKERSGTQVLTEVILVTVIVAFFCFASVVAAQHANRAIARITRNEL
jgi:xenotropic and polytropic retrovirus receptor 1